jgi:uncharacterized membrane protein
MAFLAHELHPSVVHLPLTLLPCAAVMDTLAASSRDRTLDAVGRGLWCSVSAAGLLAGLSGMAASQEVRADEPRARRRMLLHGLGNATVLTTALGVTAWRSVRRASWATAGVGLVGTAVALVAATLGGEMVYSDGVGVKALPASAPQGVNESPPLFRNGGLVALLRDAVQGAAWLARNAGEALRWDATTKRALVPGP